MPVSHHSQPRHPWPTRSAPRGNWRQRVPAHPTSTTPKLEGLGDEVAWTRSLVIRAEPSPPVLPTVQGQEWGCEWRERHGPKGEGPVLRTESKKTSACGRNQAGEPKQRGLRGPGAWDCRVVAASTQNLRTGVGAGAWRPAGLGPAT